jgi:hypothetical protein
MKIRLFPIFCLSFLGISVFAQNLDKNYTVLDVNKQVCEIAGENPYTSPLENYVARIHLWIDGKYDTVYSGMIDAAVRQIAPKPYPQKAADNLLSSEIEQIVIYKDSVGLVFRKEKNDPDCYFVGMSNLENGKWLGTGEDICFAKSMNEAKQYIENKSTKSLERLRQYYRQRVVSTDTIAFINYLKQTGKNPQKYLLDKLGDYQLVIYGEIHRRQLSWNLLKSLINQTDFPQKCGTIFLELPYYNNLLFDKIMQSNELDTLSIFKILGSEQQYGWQDKGEYEFIKEVWKINKKTKNKIKIIPVDYQINWDNIRTKNSDDYHTFVRNNFTRDRDSIMAQIIYNHIINKPDKRNCLFIVGQDHARKSSPNMPAKAGTLLKELMGKNVFSITSHSLINDNTHWLGEVRYGLFDSVFEKNKNLPVAFDLKNSPFGKEPFDALQNIRFILDCGNYEDFYDGYIFLYPLKSEPYEYELKELYTLAFVEELKRRAYISNSKEAYYNLPVDSVSVEKIHNQIDSDLQRSNNRRYWTFYNK